MYDTLRAPKFIQNQTRFEKYNTQVISEPSHAFWMTRVLHDQTKVADYSSLLDKDSFILCLL